MLLFRYLAKEIYTTMIVIVMVLLLVLISAQFLHYLQYVAEGKITVIVLMKIMGLEVPLLLGYLLPLGFFLAVIITIGRMCIDHELVVVSACGVSHAKLLGMITMIATVVMLLTAWLMFHIEPKVQWYRLKMLKVAQVSYSLSKITPGTFQQLGKLELYAGSQSDDHHQLNDVFAAVPMNKSSAYPNGSWQIIRAQKATEYVDPKTFDSYVVLHHGAEYQGSAKQLNYQITQFKRYAIRLATPTHGLSQKDRIKYMSTKELWHERHQGPEAAELQWRLAMPLSILILGLLALPLAYVNPRRGKFGRVFPAILLYLIYVNMIFVCRSWIYSGSLSPELGMWWLHAAFLMIALLFNAAHVGWKRFFTFALRWEVEKDNKIDR